MTRWAMEQTTIAMSAPIQGRNLGSVVGGCYRHREHGNETDERFHRCDGADISPHDRLTRLPMALAQRLEWLMY